MSIVELSNEEIWDQMKSLVVQLECDGGSLIIDVRNLIEFINFIKEETSSSEFVKKYIIGKELNSKFETEFIKKFFTKILNIEYYNCIIKEVDDNSGIHFNILIRNSIDDLIEKYLLIDFKVFMKLVVSNELPTLAVGYIE